MKINAKVVGYGPDPERTQALVNIIVEFSGSTKSMTLTVVVPNEGDEADLRKKGIARAKDFALQFAADGSSLTRGAGRHAGPASRRAARARCISSGYDRHLL